MFRFPCWDLSRKSWERIVHLRLLPRAKRKSVPVRGTRLLRKDLADGYAYLKVKIIFCHFLDYEIIWMSGECREDEEEEEVQTNGRPRFSAGKNQCLLSREVITNLSVIHCLTGTNTPLDPFEIKRAFHPVQYRQLCFVSSWSCDGLVGDGSVRWFERERPPLLSLACEMSSYRIP